MDESKGLPLTGLQRDLIPVNAVIGFLKRDRRWPSILYSLGYRLAMIEQPISVVHGTAEIDVICLNHKENHALLWECKSGHTVEEKQARVYTAATAEDVQRTGNITFPNPASASVEAAYCCLEADHAKVANSLDKYGVAIPVVALGDEAKLVRGAFTDAKLTSVLSAGVRLPPLQTVPRFLVANTHTPKSRVARAVFPTMVACLRKQIGKVSVAHLLEETFPDWACMGRDLRRYLSEVVKEIVIELCKNELKEFARVLKATVSPQETFIEFSADVLGQDASGRTRTFQKLAKLAYGYIERTEENRPYDPNREAESGWLFPLEPGSGE